MQNTFIQIQNDSIIIDRSDLTMYAAIAAVALVLLIVVVVAVKSRKKSFIKTVPTNLKDGE